VHLVGLIIKNSHPCGVHVLELNSEKTGMSII